MRKMLIFAIVFPLMLVVASCGGGDSENGGISPPPPPPASEMPVFTSPATVSVAENVSGTIYTAVATGPTGSSIQYFLRGPGGTGSTINSGLPRGDDDDIFQLDRNGNLSFRSVPPDFENPLDINGDNIYNIIIYAERTDLASRPFTSLRLSITVTDRTDGAFRVRRVGTGFAQPLYLTGVPDTSGRVFVVEQGGRIRILNPATGAIAATPFLDVSASISSGGERGLLGFVPARDFATSGTIYVYVTNPAGDTEVRRYRTQSDNRDVIDPASADVILTFAQPFANHNGGWMDFGPEGFLYIASGDGGSGGDPQNNAQTLTNLLGKILRIDVSRDAFPDDPNRDYAIPSGNSFTAPNAPEIFAFGLRNPFRASFDPVTRRLYIGDVGQNAIEEIDLIPFGQAGLNFGWARLEGTQTFSGTPPAGATPPITEYSHGTGPRQGNSVTGGYVYRGPVESLQGLYFFGDFVTGAIWSLPSTSLIQGQTVNSSQFIVRTQEFAPNEGRIGNIASFGVDRANNLYIIDFDGEIFVIEPA